MTIENAFCVEFKPTIWHRLGFGHAGVAPWGDSDDDHYIISDTIVVMDWKDRLRALITGRIHVAVRTKTDTPVGRTEARSAAKVLGWGWTAF